MEVPLQLPPERRVYANRTLNLRTIRAIGYDMDYTLVPYATAAWETAAYEAGRASLAAKGWPVEELRFDPEAVTQGLVFDLELGNVVKATRFGYVIRAAHGTRVLDYNELRRDYSGTFVDLSEPRWVFANTMFSLSQSSLYCQLVDHLDAGRIDGVIGYGDLYAAVKRAIDEAHMGDDLKPGILADPERFVEADRAVPAMLLDQRHAGKTTMLITNSDWNYTRQMMRIAVDPFLPSGTAWRDLFDIVIVSARKPVFFTSEQPAFPDRRSRQGPARTALRRTRGRWRLRRRGRQARREEPEAARRPAAVRRGPPLRRRARVQDDAALAYGADRSGAGRRAHRRRRLHEDTGRAAVAHAPQG